MYVGIAIINHQFLMVGIQPMYGDSGYGLLLLYQHYMYAQIQKTPQRIQQRWITPSRLNLRLRCSELCAKYQGLEGWEFTINDGGFVMVCKG